MRKFTLLLALIGLVCMNVAQAQVKPGTKGDGEVFFTETFDWANPNDPRGWSMPAGYYIEDPLDLGYVWHWYPNIRFDARWTNDPPFESRTPQDGHLALFLDKYNWDNGTELNTDASIVFPKMDCSARSSVILRYLTHFMSYSVARMTVEVTVDDWVHSSVYNVNFGCGHKDRPRDKAPGKPALLELNISDVAAGMANVQFKIRWWDTRLYFWVIDDLELAEAYDNDLRLTHFTVEWDNEDANNKSSGYYMIPKSQLNGVRGFLNWEAAAINFGENDQDDVYMDLTITKNSQVIWQRQSPPKFTLGVLDLDTARIADKFVPADFGHYMVKYNYKQNQQEQSPENDEATFFFHVNDSVYSRSDDTSELKWSYGFERYTTESTSNEDFFTGSIFPIIADCEVNSISVYIQGGLADGDIEFQFQLWFNTQDPEGASYEKLLVTEMLTLDSSMFDTWITLPFEKDGESEFLRAGDLVYAGISYWDYHTDFLVRRRDGIRIGTDATVKMVAPTAIGIYDGNVETGLGSFVGKRNLMCRLNINDNSNIIDGVNTTRALSALGQNYPNPFRNNTEIRYELGTDSDVVVKVMDLTGRVVMEINEGFKPAGSHTLRVNASSLEAGIYMYTLKAGGFTETKRMIVSE